MFYRIFSVASDELKVADDGLLSPDVGSWAQDKYRLIALYDELFSTGMKYKWGQRAYIDLYAGSGYSHVSGTNIFLKGSPVIALTVTDQFDKYIFCEQETDRFEALSIRTKRIAPAADATLIQGNCDVEIDRICAAIPKPSPGNTVLSLCLVDPFDFGIKFETLRKLSRFYVDFLALLAIGMDANRNYDHYVDGASDKLDEALGNRDWRKRWAEAGAPRAAFRTFLATEFSTSMASLGYRDVTVDRMKAVRSTEKNLNLYYLALFSRHQTGFQFWDQVLKYSTDQPGFDW